MDGEAYTSEVRSWSDTLEYGQYLVTLLAPGGREERMPITGGVMSVWVFSYQGS